MTGTNNPVLDIFLVRDNPKQVREMMQTHYPKKASLMSDQQRESIRRQQQENRARRLQ